MRTIKAFTLFILFPISIYAQKRGVDEFKKLINQQKSSDTQINFDGYYDLANKYSQSELILSQPQNLYFPVFFFKNGLICFSNGFMKPINRELFKPKALTQKDHLLDWGTYKIIGNRINAIIFVAYEGGFPFWDAEATYYSGIIKNKETISNWHPVAPYPKFKHKKVARMDTTSHTLYFHALDDKRLIDSSKAWVNKYRE